MGRCSWMVWNVVIPPGTGGRPPEDGVMPESEVELELEFEARPLSRLVVEFLHPPEDTDSTVAILAELSSPGLSRPGLFGMLLPRLGMTSASKVNLVKAGEVEEDDSPFGALEKVLMEAGWCIMTTLDSSRCSEEYWDKSLPKLEPEPLGLENPGIEGGVTFLAPWLNRCDRFMPPTLLILLMVQN